MKWTQMKTPANIRSSFVAIALTLGLMGCSSLPSLKDLNPWHKENQVRSLSVFVAPDPSLRFALNIDVVFVYSDAVLAMVNNLKGNEWFSQKSGIVSAYSNQVKVLEWQMVSGYADEGRSLPEDHSDALAVIAFAYYPPNPDARVVLNEFKNPWLVFAQGKLVASEVAPISTAPQKGDKK